MSLEYVDSFETQSPGGRYCGTSGGVGFRSRGRGSGHVGSLSINSSGRLGRTVAAAATKIQSIAFHPFSLAKTGIFYFVETGFATQHVYIGMTSTGKIEVRRGSNTGTVLATSLAVWMTTASYRWISAKVTISDTVGAFVVKIDGTTVTWDSANTNVDTKNAGSSGLIEECWVGSDDANNDSDYDDWHINNTSGSVNNDLLDDRRVGYSAANAAGTYSSATASSGTLVSCVDESANNGDTDYVLQDATGLPKKVSFNVENAPSNTLAIFGVQPVIDYRKDDAGVDTLRQIVISGAAEIDNGADVNALSTYQELLQMLENDPNTTAAWTISGFNAIEVGTKRVACASAPRRSGRSIRSVSATSSARPRSAPSSRTPN
jgi:hypothetical protein